MKKIVLVSDSHYRPGILNYIKETNADSDFFFHLGDSDIRRKDLTGFDLALRGNHDFDESYPIEESIEIEGINIWLTHGHTFHVSQYNKDELIKNAKQRAAKIVFFGHTHHFEANKVDDIYFINPGSCSYNRDFTKPSYAIVYLDQTSLKVERKDIPDYFKIKGR